MEDTAGTIIEQLARWADAMTRTLDSWDTGTLIVLAVTLTVLAGVTGRATTGADSSGRSCGSPSPPYSPSSPSRPSGPSRADTCPSPSSKRSCETSPATSPSSGAWTRRHAYYDGDDGETGYDGVTDTGARRETDVERRIIMCRRHPVLAFDYDPSSGKAVGSGRILDCSRLPLELISHGKPAIYAKSIDAWWRRRAIPPTRDGIRGILDSMGIRSAVELLNRSHGLSLSDQYWVKPESSDLEWDTVNFFTNPFDEELGRTLLTARSSSHRFSLNAPDASTGGDLPKRWTIAGDGTRILIKAGRTGQEPVNELIASDLCSRLGIPAVRYNLGEYDNRPVSTCPEMLTDTEELVSAWQILESVKRDNRLSARDQWIRAAQLFGCEGAAVVHATDDWLLVDYLMRNIDRHYNNFGLIRDVETLRVRPAPLFDTGASLWCGELAIDNRDYKAKPFYATYKTPTARRQLRLISDWTRYDLGKLDGWEEQVGHRLSVTGLVPETRITAIATMLSARIREVRSLAESAGDDSTHKTVVMGAETGIGTGMLPWPSPMEQVETGNLHWQSTTSGPTSF